MQYVISLLIALLSTVIFYGAPPLLLLKLRKKPIRIRNFRLFCILSTVCVWALFRVLFYLLGMKDSSHGGPAILWGTVFYNYVISRLHKSGRIYETMPSLSNVQSETDFESAEAENSDTSSALPDPASSFHIELIKKRKYDTFYTCPSCGCLVQKGTYTCECGFVFRKLHDWRKIVIRFSVSLVIAAALIGSSFASFRLGQTSMQSEIQSQYDEGYMKGRQSGYDTGYIVGGDSFASTFFEDGYRTAMSDAGLSSRLGSGHLIKYFKQRDSLHSSLSSDYGFGNSSLKSLDERLNK